MMASWSRGPTVGKGTAGFVSLAYKSASINQEDHLDLPPVLAVKSAEFSRSHSLQREREFLHLFQDCSHVIRCFGADASEEDGVILYNLMLEFASGGSLADQIYGSSCFGFLEHEVRQHTKSVLLGLSYIHSQGYAHCDLKPDNILLVDDSEGNTTAKISDFGLARKVRENKKWMKRKKGFRGTPLYMAPESIIYGKYESKADIWALGCTVIEMLTGKPAWDFDERIELGMLLDQIGNEEVDIPRGLSKDAEDFLDKCLIRNPELRWTADMLLGHPFVSCLDKEAVIREGQKESSIGTKSEESIISSSCSDSYGINSIIKPRLLLNAPVGLSNKVTEDSVSGGGVVLKPKVSNSASEKSDEFPLFKRRRRFDHRVLHEAIKCNANFGLLRAC